MTYEPAAVPRVGESWVIRLEHRPVRMLATIVQEPDDLGVTLHVTALHREGESQRYPLAQVEFVGRDPHREEP